MGFWATREAKARSTVILTVSHGIQAEIEYMWSANDIYRHISSTRKVDTTSRRADLSARISLLRLPFKASPEQMLEHYESYSSLSAEAISSGVRIDDWEKSERLLMSLGDDLESLKIQWAVLPEDRQVWTELVRMYKSLAVRRGLELNRTTPAQVSFLTKDAPKGPKMDNSQSRKGKGKGGGGGGSGKGKGGG